MAYGLNKQYFRDWCDYMKNNPNKQKIIEATKKVVTEKGIYNTTLQSIADEAGISKGALYYYYNTKDSILYDVMDDYSSRITGLARLLGEVDLDIKTIADEAYSIVYKSVAETEENKLFVHLLYQAILGNDEIREKFNLKYEQWVRGIEDVLLAIYKIPSSSVTKSLAVLIEAALDGLILKELLGIHLEENKEALKLFLPLFHGQLADCIKYNPM